MRPVGSIPFLLLFFICWRTDSGDVVVEEAVSHIGHDQQGKQNEGENGHGEEDQGVQRQALVRVGAISGSGEMSPKDVGAAGEGLLGLIDCVSAEDDGIARDAGLGIDDGVSAEDRGAAPHLAAYIQVSEENERAAGEFAFDLYGAEEAGRIVRLLAGGNEDVLPDIGTIARRLDRRVRGKQKHKSECAERVGQQSSPKATELPVMGTQGIGYEFRSSKV
jgi:hypothetical protein